MTAELLQDQLDAQREKVDVDHFDLTVRELMRMSSEGELERARADQRRFRWDAEKESRLIESLLLGLPVPSIFVATNRDGSWEVVDGLQRISTLIHFTAEAPDLLESIGKDEPLALEGLKDLTAFNGLRYSELPMPVQLAFNKRLLRVTALSDKSKRETRFELFERLNAGALELEPQEVRAAIYRSPFNDLLRELAYSEPFRSLVRLQRGKEHNGTREELVLKFFAYLENRSEFKGAVTDFLNDFMEQRASEPESAHQTRRDLFTKVVDEVWEFTDHEPFRRRPGITPLVELEAVLVGAAEVINAGGQLRRPPGGWQSDDELVASSTGATNTPAMLRRRIDRAKALMS